MRAIVAVLIWFCTTAAAQAGAWPRGEGNTFVAISSDQNQAQIYAEYGLPGDWTLGADVTMSAGRQWPDLMAFVHHPIWRGAGGGILSGGFSFGIRDARRVGAFRDDSGAAQGASDPETALRSGLFWGKGFQSAWGDGWTTLEAQAENAGDRPWGFDVDAIKLDALVGIKPGDRLKLMAQVQGYQRTGGPILVRLEPSVAWGVGAHGNLVLSPSMGVRGAFDPRVKLGVWLDF